MINTHIFTLALGLHNQIKTYYYLIRKKQAYKHKMHCLDVAIEIKE